jgi:hypothetical protein
MNKLSDASESKYRSDISGPYYFRVRNRPQRCLAALLLDALIGKLSELTHVICLSPLLGRSRLLALGSMSMGVSIGWQHVLHDNGPDACLLV